ncbi:hypothetical protein ACR60W_001052 [Listeria monocytogenes]|nr:hypothetical protein [Listeria monocytogenes]EFU8667277.1 hypothetical protein [Listeria monocytogenes]
MKHKSCYMDELYHSLIAKLRNNEGITTLDLSNALWLYEKAIKFEDTGRDKEEAE